MQLKNINFYLAISLGVIYHWCGAMPVKSPTKVIIKRFLLVNQKLKTDWKIKSEIETTVKKCTHK